MHRLTAMATSITTTRNPAHSLALPSRYVLLAILIVAAGLRFYALDHSSLWSDEGNTYALIQRSFTAIARDAAADIHPPGYYWLLKVWAMIFGNSAAAMRAFSALAGVALVAVVYAIGRLLDRHTGNRSLIAITAATFAALNPFQLYYSQEARMYMLLALAGAILFWALLAWMEQETLDKRVTAPVTTFVLAGALGLWTHYSFPILLSAAGLAYLWHWRTLLRDNRTPIRAITRYTVANLAIVLSFAPWLPIAINRVLNWPQGGKATPLSEGMLLTIRTLTFGPLRNLPESLWPWLVVAALLPMLGVVALALAARRQEKVTNQVAATFGSGCYLVSVDWVTLALWLFAPVALMFALGLFSDAFLKFLLTASPAWALLCAAAPLLLPRPQWGVPLLIVAAVGLAVMVLPLYYTSSTVRDNYAGVAAYIENVGDPESDLVILNAPGQADVWSYYAPPVPTIGLPQSRPPDATATIAQLEEAVTGRHRVFSLFWATDEADPDRLVESWLDQHAFRGWESWQGNMRFVVYTFPNELRCADVEPPTRFGDAIQLIAHCQPDFPQRVPAGEVALLGLRWQTEQQLTSRYKVTVQLLDARNQVIAQHDAEPGGGSLPTDSWQVNTPIMDNHGMPIEFGTPPGVYRMIVALYDEHGRLATASGDAYELGEVEVVRADRSVPLAIVPMHQRTNTQLGPVTLVGYEAYKKDHSHAPETPLQAGDIAHFTFYWQAPDPLPGDWPDDLYFTLTLGEQTMTAPLAGGAFPTAAWQTGELIRGEFDLLYDGSSATPVIEVNGNRHRLKSLPR
jgi:mannosyltransferase